jgi:alginate O-acetyltransferase complex protein AlgI
MLFNSAAFAVFFPVAFLVYWALRTPARQNVWIVLSSAVFYGWWDWRFLGLLYFSCGMDFVLGRAIESRRLAGRSTRGLLLLSVVSNLGLLGFFKYFNFFVDSARPLLDGLGLHPGVVDIVLPVGISFYTFQSLSYTVDVHRGEIPAEKSFTTFVAYVTFFPQLVAGPIERAQTLLPQMQRARTLTLDAVRSGLALALVGFLKKLILADALAAPIAEGVFGASARGATPGATEVLLGTYAFALQIYGDFSGYSDIARGTSRLLGIELVVNFRQPYVSRSITEFWRRWHLSLSFWLRDYLYISLGGNRGGQVATMRNLMLTMLLGGLWHGAAWTFVLWGALHGTFLAVERVLRWRDPAVWPRWRQLVGALLTFHLVCLTWVPFRAASVGSMWDLFAALGGPWRAPDPLMLAAVGIGAGLLVLVDLPHLLHAEEDPPHADRPAWFVWTAAALALGVYLLPPLGSASFIYFQF